jgi:hypothetical protein
MECVVTIALGHGHSKLLSGLTLVPRLFVEVRLEDIEISKKLRKYHGVRYDVRKWADLIINIASGSES